MMIFHIAARELRSLFLSPLAWAILGVVEFLVAFLFLTALEQFMVVQPQLATMEGAPGVTDFVAGAVFNNAAIILMLVAPLLTMRLVSEEHRNRTLSLLFSAPVSMSEIILGKYLGLFAFFLIMLGLLAAMPLSLLVGADLDLGKLGAGVLGLGLLLAAFAAAGLFMSTLTEQPTVAAVSTFGLLLLLWIIDWAGEAIGSEVSGLTAYLSLSNHHESFIKGLFDSADALYFVLFVVTFLVMSIRRLDAYRLQH